MGSTSEIGSTGDIAADYALDKELRIRELYEK